MTESLGPARRSSKSNGSPAEKKDILARTYAGARERMREVCAHHPASLVIVVDGQVVAVRDISSPRAILRVETHSIKTLEMVEVFSEQNLPMLILPVSQHPPQSPPELRNEVALSGDRSLSLTLRFTCEGAQIEAIYLDPHFETDIADADVHSIMDFGGDGARVEDTRHSVDPDKSKVETREGRPQRRFSLRLPRAAFTMRTLLPAAMGLLLVAVMAGLFTSYQREQTRIADILHDSTRAERQQRISHGPGVIHQQVEIRGGGRTIRRDLYRDIDGRRHPKAHAIDNDARALRQKLAEADLDWNDPLSAAGFDNWHDHVPHKSDRVEKIGPNLLTVTTTPTSGPVLRETLSLRLTDLHPVSRSLILADREAIEVAELSYEVVPWGPFSEEWFDPSNSVPDASPQHRLSLPGTSGPPRVSEQEIDVAKLGVLLAIQELSADAERLQVNRAATGVVVTGIVETEARKLEIASRLRTIPHVIADIHSYRDFDGKPDSSPTPTTVQAMSVVAGASPLDDYCETRQILRERCQQIAYLLLKTSATLIRAASQIADLQRQYPSVRPLTPAAQVLLAELMHHYVLHINAAVSEEQNAFSALGIEHPAVRDGSGNHDENLHEAIQHNFNLTKELVYAKDEHSGAPLSVIRDLAESAEEVRAAVSDVPMNTINRAAAPQ
jgi:hypothetical protein